VVDELREKHGFLILRGNEITTDQGDMIVFGCDKEITGVVHLEDLREEVTRAGGFISVAHPFRGFLTFGVNQLGLTPKKAMERPLFRIVDGVEVLNSRVTKDENNLAREVAEGLKLPITGGSDAHHRVEVGIYATKFQVKIESEADLIEALKGDRYTPVAFRERE
jgi:predicted metal-dependent phosphoesterase TrpH